MTRAERVANMIGVVVPFLGLIAAVVLLWQSWVGWIDLGILAGLYVLYGLGITVGYHRLLTHRAFATYKPVEYGFAVVGSMGLQGGVLDWVADHRKHHAHTDQEGDPHSPHVGHGEGLAGLWHAHTGWLFETHGQADWKRYAKELYEDRGMKRINHHAFPRSANHGLRWWEVDVSGLIIGAMKRVGLAWNVVRISPERQAARVAKPAEKTAVPV